MFSRLSQIVRCHALRPPLEAQPAARARQLMAQAIGKPSSAGLAVSGPTSWNTASSRAARIANSTMRSTNLDHSLALFPDGVPRPTTLSPEQPLTGPAQALPGSGSGGNLGHPNQVVELALEQPVLRARRVEARLGASRPAALNVLRQLEVFRVLVESGGGPRGPGCSITVPSRALTTRRRLPPSPDQRRWSPIAASRSA